MWWALVSLIVLAVVLLASRQREIPDGKQYIAVGCRSLFHPHGDDSHVVIANCATFGAARRAARVWAASHPAGEARVLIGGPGADPEKAKWFRCS